MSKELKVEILPVQCDVTKEEDVDMLFNEVMKKFGKVDILVNNSGTSWGAQRWSFL